MVGHVSRAPAPKKRLSRCYYRTCINRDLPPSSVTLKRLHAAAAGFRLSLLITNCGALFDPR